MVAFLQSRGTAITWRTGPIGPQPSGNVRRHWQPRARGQHVIAWTRTTFAAGSNSVNPGVGVLTLAGFAPSVAVTANQFATPGAGALTLAGFAPTVTRTANQVVSPGVAALTLAGPSPVVNSGASQAASPGVGALSLAGFAPSVAQSLNQFAAPGAGPLVLAGLAPGVAQTANQAVGPAAGPLILAGYAPTVTVYSASPNLTPGAGALVLSGYAPTIVQAAVVTNPCEVVWDQNQYNSFVATFPEFAAVPFGRTALLFDMAQCTLLDNSCGSPVTDMCYRTHLFYLLVGHLLLLLGNNPTQPDNTPPGRINSATEGTITSSFEYLIPPGSMSAAWYLQTKYGAMYWTATVRFRSLRYVANGSSGIGFSKAYGVAPFDIPGGI